ncbi:MAG: hypothetical protein HFJ55_05155 [Clostridia bacterium]|jgi:hypothetical protein|nr:hypothetical protein [Clostridia bacterium]
MKDVILNEILEERINENKDIFADKELKTINCNDIIIKKIYLLGLLDGKSSL